jgi:hypothetical protein
LICAALPSTLSMMYTFSSLPRNIYPALALSRRSTPRFSHTYHHAANERVSNLLKGAGLLRERAPGRSHGKHRLCADHRVEKKGASTRDRGAQVVL